MLHLPANTYHGNRLLLMPAEHLETPKQPRLQGYSLLADQCPPPQSSLFQFNRLMDLDHKQPMHVSFLGFSDRPLVAQV